MYIVIKDGLEHTRTPRMQNVDFGQNSIDHLDAVLKLT